MSAQIGVWYCGCVQCVFMFMCGGGGGEFMVIVINCTVLQVRLLHGGRTWSNSIVTLCLTCPRISWPAKWIQQKWCMHEVAFQYTSMCAEHPLCQCFATSDYVQLLCCWLCSMKAIGQLLPMSCRVWLARLKIVASVKYILAMPCFRCQMHYAQLGCFSSTVHPDALVARFLWAIPSYSFLTVEFLK